MTTGAKFLRADLHIHSYGEFGSYDVTDVTMTPQAIVDMAVEKGLGIISITDHNEIFNSNATITYAQGKNIFVIPGIEVSTTQGHLLLYFPSFNDLRNFHGKLSISTDKKTCQNGIVQCLDFAQQHNGIGILAHIELDSGFEKTIGRFGPPMEEIFKHKNLLGLEICTKDNNALYTDLDTNPNRKRLIALYRETCDYNESYNLAKLLSSDAHDLNKLGINAEGGKKLTRIKIDELNFHAFKVALISQESRVRLEDFIPEQRPIIKSIHIDGGLLDKVNIDLSPNLTCIIGGRGTGKSTLLEAIRESSGNKSNARVVNSDVWPQNISLVYEDEAGQLLEFKREKFADNQNITDPVNGISKIDVESYGQGDTAETLQHCDSNPMILVGFLDAFLNLDTLKNQNNEIVTKLRENQSDARKLRLELLSLPDTKKALLNEQKKLENLKKEKAGELVKYQTALIKERQLREGLIDDLKNLIKTYKDIFKDDTTFKNFEGLSDSEIVVGKDYFKKVKEIVFDFSKIVSEKSGELNTALNQKIEELKIELANWQKEEKTIQEEIDKKKKTLEAQGIPFDLGKINQISRDIADLTARVQKLESNQKLLKELEVSRKSLITNRVDVKNKIYYYRREFANTINDNLKNTIDGLFITVKYSEGKYSDEFEKLLKTTMDWRTSQVPRASIISANLSPLGFVDICRKNDQAMLKVLVDSNGNRLLSDSEILNMIEKVMKDCNYEEFEALEYEDRPSITVTKVFTDDQGCQQRYTKSITQLSLGQQQSILLGILLQSKSNKPLIIDQPEDNLDSEFIFKTIVMNLRKIKESRQVIIVTHNPNIAVLGDAELIVPLKSTNIRSHIISSGSIDREETRKICCEILEGGHNAFKQRQIIYGI
jgi:DNA repair ATPase RecN/histidinol phosphatase-like PHP family hydrolase